MYKLLIVVGMVISWISFVTCQRYDCQTCISKKRVWCPESDEYKKGQCFTPKQVKAVAKVIERNLCSDVPQISANLTADIKIFTCPYKTNCGRNDLSIVPPFDEKPQYLVYRDFRKFKSKAYCRHEVSFPIDATFGDTIKIDVKDLQRTEVFVGMATSWDNSSELIGKKFSRTSLGSIEVKYPDKAFLVTKYKYDKKVKSAKYKIEVKFVAKKKQVNATEIGEIDIKTSDLESKDVDQKEKQTLVVNEEEIVYEQVENENLFYVIIGASGFVIILMIVIVCVLCAIWRQKRFNDIQKQQDMLEEEAKRQKKEQEIIELKKRNRILVGQMKQFFYADGSMSIDGEDAVQNPQEQPQEEHHTDNGLEVTPAPNFASTVVHNESAATPIYHPKHEAAPIQYQMSTPNMFEDLLDKYSKEDEDYGANIRHNSVTEVRRPMPSETPISVSKAAHFSLSPSSNKAGTLLPSINQPRNRGTFQVQEVDASEDQSLQDIDDMF